MGAGTETGTGGIAGTGGIGGLAFVGVTGDASACAAVVLNMLAVPTDTAPGTRDVRLISRANVWLAIASVASVASCICCSASRSLSRSLSRMGRPALGDYRRMSSSVIKFKRKGGFRSGITLGEAMADAHLSSNDQYSLYDLNADGRGRIILKIRVSLPHILTVQYLPCAHPRRSTTVVDGVQLDDIRAPGRHVRRASRAPDARAEDRTGVRALLAGKHAFCCARSRRAVPCLHSPKLRHLCSCSSLCCRQT